MIGENLKKLRKKNKMGQTEVAKAIHVSNGVISLWENNLRTPSFDTLKKLASLFNVSICDILEDANYERDNKFAEFTEKQKELLPIIQMLNDRQCQRTYDYLSGMLDISAEEQKKWQANEG